MSLSKHCNYLNKEYFDLFLKNKALCFKSYSLYNDPYEFPFYKNHRFTHGNFSVDAEVIGWNFFVMCFSDIGIPDCIPLWENHGKNGAKLHINLPTLTKKINELLKPHVRQIEVRELKCTYHSQEEFREKIQRITNGKTNLSFDDIFQLSQLKRDFFQWENETRLVIGVKSSYSLVTEFPEIKDGLLKIPVHDVLNKVIELIQIYPESSSFSTQQVEQEGFRQCRVSLDYKQSKKILN
jgi:hypothetical protein